MEETFHQYPDNLSSSTTNTWSSSGRKIKELTLYPMEPYLVLLKRDRTEKEVYSVGRYLEGLFGGDEYWAARKVIEQIVREEQ